MTQGKLEGKGCQGREHWLPCASFQSWTLPWPACLLKPHLFPSSLQGNRLTLANRDELGLLCAGHN